MGTGILSVLVSADDPEWARRVVDQEQMDALSSPGLLELALRRRDGDLLPVETRITRTHAPDGGVADLALAMRDLTARGMAEEELRDANERATFCHHLLLYDIADQLRAVTGGLSLACRPGVIDEVLHAVEIAEEAVSACQHIVMQVGLLRTARATKLEELDLQRLLLKRRSRGSGLSTQRCELTPL